MSIFCCCRGRRTIYRESDLERQDIIELPVHPPRAKLSKPPLPTSELELSPPQIVTTKAPSLLHDSIPEATVDPAILEVEDSDDDEPIRSTRNSSTGTLGAIKTKFIRPLSQKSESRRHSQQSLGTSDEEIARRAELKRLMHKRIQEELKSEEEQEEVEVKASNLDELKPENSTNIGLPGGGPRDNLEFSVSDPSVNEVGSKDLVLVSPDDVFLALPISNSQPRISLRRSSCPGSPCRSHENSVSENHGSIKERGSLPQFPTSPQLAPVHLPSARGSESLCSWRLSYSAEHFTNYIEFPDNSKSDRDSQHIAPSVRSERSDKEDDKHEDSIKRSSLNVHEPLTNIEPTENAQSHDPCPIHCQRHDLCNTEDSEDPHTENSHDTSPSQDSPLHLWLRSQELQSPSAVSSRRTSTMISRMLPGSSSLDGRLSQSGELSTSHDLRETVQHASDNLPEKLRHPESRISHEDTAIAPIYVPESWFNEPQQSIMKATNDIPADGVPKPVDYNFEASSSHYTSSRYTTCTRPNSGQTAEKEPRSKLIELLGGRKAISPFSTFNRLISPSRATDAEKSDISSYKTALNEASALDITMYRQPAEANSGVLSDTASFKQREEELKSIEQRFGQVRRDTTPIASKFREEFDEPATPSNTKNSIFAKLHFPKSKRSKQLSKDAQEHSIQGAKYNGRENTYPGFSRLGSQELEKGAKPEDVENGISPRPHTVALGEGVPDAQQYGEIFSQSQTCPEPTQVEQEQLPCISKQKTTNLDRTGSGIGDARAAAVTSSKPGAGLGSNLKLPNRLEDNSSQQSKISNSVLREWVNLMNGQDSQPQAESNDGPQDRIPRRLRTPPASWARWPSHTRNERTGPAGKEDRVISRDFAVQGASNASAPWTTENPIESSKKYITPAPRSLSGQLSRAVKGSLSRVHGSLHRNVRASSETLRNRKKPDGHLEYPELEILPMQGGYEELQALEEQIGTMKRGSITAESQLARLASDSTRTPLSARLAEEVHMMKHIASMDPCEDDEVAMPISQAAFSVALVASKPALLSPQGGSEVTDRFATPESHVSYEDCVPKHMLEDESVDNTMMAENSHDTQAA
ncbi:hypothetical protein M434DRAFT_29240 [Hypoxylon sp. CO27-5]|nr:hypothetical protein M434DRAFT_29240 [Hypoxylon sp. CO27-5]